DRVEAPLRIDGRYQVEPKGVSRTLVLYEIGAIGAPFGLSLPSRVAPLRPLDVPLPVGFTVLEEKFVGRTVHEGQLTRVSAIGAGMEPRVRPALLSNLQVKVAATARGNPSGEIYGKVVDSGDRCASRVRIRFASVTPELKAWIAATAASAPLLSSLL